MADVHGGKAAGGERAAGVRGRFVWARTAIAVAVIAIFAGAGAWIWQQYAAQPGGLALATADPARIEAGAAIYRSHCAACHGARLEGQPNWRQRNANGRLPAPPHDDSGHTWHHPDRMLFEITRDGMKPPIAPDGYQSDMPGFGAVLSDEQIWSVLAFIASRWSQREREHQARVTRAHEAPR